MTAALTLTAIAPAIKVNGTLMPDHLTADLVTVKVSKGFQLPARTELSFDDTGFVISKANTFRLGATVEVEMSTGTVLFAGVVTGVELTMEGGTPELTVVADDRSYTMTLGAKIRTFSNQTYADVIRTIAGEHGLQVDIGSLPGTWDHLTQSCSDYDFLCEIAERTGSDWWVEGTKLLFRKATSTGTPVAAEYGANLEKFSVRSSVLHDGEVTSAGWDSKTKQAVRGTADPVDLLPDALWLEPFLKGTELASKSKVLTADGVPLTVAEARALASQTKARTVRGAVTARGTCRVEAGLVPGGKVNVSNVGPVSGIYHVTAVEHSYSARGFRTRFTAGSRVPSGLVDQLAGAARGSSLHRDVLVVGIVTNNKDPENRGRVKVKLPSIDDATESAWARMVVPDAGKDRGIFFVPEINDEVIVGFEGGDTRRPLVIGSVFNGQDVPPATNVDGGVKLRTIRSRKGHQIQIGDGDQPTEEFVAITLAPGHVIKLAKDQLTVDVPSGTPVVMTSGQTKIEMTKSGDITMKATNIRLDATADLELSAANVKVKAKAKAETSGAIVEIKATGTAEVSATGMVQVKGAMVKIN